MYATKLLRRHNLRSSVAEWSSSSFKTPCSYNNSTLFPYSNQVPCSYNVCSPYNNPSYNIWSYKVPLFFFSRFVASQASSSSPALEASPPHTADNTQGNEDLACKIADVISKYPWCSSTEDELQDFSPVSFSTVLAVLNLDIALEPALNFFSWAGNQPGFLQSADDVMQVAQLWASKYALFTLTSLQDTLTSNGPQYNEATWVAMMSASSILKMPDQSVSIFRMMKKCGCKATQLSCDPLLFALVKCNRLDDALLSVQEMFTAGILPSVRILGNFLDYMCKAGKVDSALTVIQDLQEVGSISYRKLVYCRMITAVWRVRDTMALDLYNEMKKKGLIPDKQAYTACVKILLKNRQFGAILSVLKDMREHDLSLDFLSCTSVIHGLYRSGRVTEALDMMEQLQKLEMPSDSKKYAALITCLFAVGKGSEAVQAFEKMQRDGHPADEVTYFVMIKNLCERGDIKLALQLKETMIQNGFQPGDRVYEALQQGFCAGSPCVPELVCLVEEIKSKGYSIIAEVYCTLITHFCVERNLDTARTWAQEMKNEGYKPTFYIKTKLGDIFEK